MDEGLPIAYPVLEDGVPVYASGGEQVGSVDHVVAAPQQDIFHGLVIRTDQGNKFVAADDVASLHEHGVDLRIAADAVPGLSAPHGAAPVRRVNEPGIKPSPWKHVLDRITGAGSHRGDWKDER